MTVKQFDDLLILRKAELIEVFNNAEDIKDLDVYTKTVLDYQEIIAKNLFAELNGIRNEISMMKGDLLKDNRERFEAIMTTLSEK